MPGRLVRSDNHQDARRPVRPEDRASGLARHRLRASIADQLKVGPHDRVLYVKAPAPDREERLVKLLGRIQSDDTASYKPFQTPEELARLVSADLALLLSERFMSLTTASDDHPLPAPDRPHHNLPVQLTSLIGREAELSTVKRAFADSRLVTLTGVGGAGESRLALQAAGDLLKEYADGAWLVELAPLSEPERVPSAVASGLAIPEDPHRPLAETLAEQFRSRQLLLVVDNCEHVLAPGADLLAPPRLPSWSWAGCANHSCTSGIPMVHGTASAPAVPSASAFNNTDISCLATSVRRAGSSAPAWSTTVIPRA
jgi:hypothetical protein